LFFHYITEIIKAVLLHAKQALRGGTGMTLPILNSAARRRWWSTPSPSFFILRKETWYPLYRRLGGSSGQSGRGWKMLLPLEFEAWIVQPTERNYIDYALPAITFITYRNIVASHMAQHSI